MTPPLTPPLGGEGRCVRRVRFADMHEASPCDFWGDAHGGCGDADMHEASPYDFWGDAHGG